MFNSKLIVFNFNPYKSFFHTRRGEVQESKFRMEILLTLNKIIILLCLCYCYFIKCFLHKNNSKHYIPITFLEFFNDI